MSQSFRIEKDSMGEVQVPQDAYYAAQTQRAVDNFPVSGLRLSRPLIAALGYIKQAAARVNGELGHLPSEIAEAIQNTAGEVIAGNLDAHFPIDIYQTGSGTSSNMNANEVITNRAMERVTGKLSRTVHPNNDVNFGQSSNDVFPTAIRIAATLQVRQQLIPALQHLHDTFLAKGNEYAHVVKTGRTHLMDAMP